MFCSDAIAIIAKPKLAATRNDRSCDRIVQEPSTLPCVSDGAPLVTIGILSDFTIAPLRVALGRSRKFIKMEDERDERILAFAVISKNGYALRDAPEAFQGDHEIVVAAVKQNGLALQFASKELQADPAIVFEAVNQNGLALAFSSKANQADRFLVMQALKSNGLALKFASATLQRDREFLLEALLHQPHFGWHFFV